MPRKITCHWHLLKITSRLNLEITPNVSAYCRVYKIKSPDHHEIDQKSDKNLGAAHTNLQCTSTETTFPDVKDRAERSHEENVD